jgi:hypothetical protein
MNTSEAGTIGTLSTSLRLQELKSKLGEIASRFEGATRVV